MSEISYNFSKKRVLVTGAAQGIGYGIAKKLAESNAVVIALDLSLKNLENLQNKVGNPSLIIPVSANLNDWNATAEALEPHFPIDYLVNNAGLAIIGPLTNISEDDYYKTFDLNVKATINTTKLIITDLIKRNAAGSIVTISSQASKAALLNHSLYCASKGAIDAFTRAVALEYGAQNIRINTVNPTVVMTELGKKIWGDAKVGRAMLDKIPLKKFAQVEDVVDAVLFLLSDAAKMVTGSHLPVDGGFLAC